MTGGADSEQERLGQLTANLAAVRVAIAAACAAAGRDPAEIQLIAVTKTFPVTDVMLLSRLGLADVGENKDQEAIPKVAACARAGLSLRWHFIGQLQTNKAASVASYADMVHSVDRIRLVRALGGGAVQSGRVMRCLVQVSLDAVQGPGGVDPGRGGADPAEVLDLAAAIEAQDGLVLGGVMAVAPLGQAARPAYARLREIAETVRAAHPAAQVISAGMSGDLGDALAEGATHVRIGTALLGGRRPFLR